MTTTLALTGCAMTHARPASLKVAWFHGFTMGQFLKNPRELTSQSDIAKAMHEPWYYSGKLATYAADGHRISSPEPVHSCAQYLDMHGHRVSPVHAADARAFMVLATMCRASGMIVSARPANRSYLRTFTFDSHLPDQLPAVLSMAVSRDREKQLRRSADKKTWREAGSITQYRPCKQQAGPYCGIYIDAHAGRQKVQLVARGDFNDDGMEDILVSANDSAHGGTWAAMHMYLLTRLQPGGKITLLREF